MARLKSKETEDEDLAKAYTEMIEQWDNHNIQYWIDKLLALRYMTECEGMIVNARKGAKRKRMGSPKFKNPLGLSKFLDGDDVDDDEGLFSHVKKEAKEDIAMDFSFPQGDNLYDISDPEELQRRVHAKIRRSGKSSASLAPSLYTPPTTTAKSKVGASPHESVSPHKSTRAY